MLTVDPASRTANVDGRNVTLSRKCFDLLAFLAEDPCRVFTKQEILEGVWGWPKEAGSATRRIDKVACRLRRELGVPGLVVAAWGVGYRLAPEDIPVQKVGASVAAEDADDRIKAACRQAARALHAAALALQEAGRP